MDDREETHKREVSADFFSFFYLLLCVTEREGGREDGVVMWAALITHLSSPVLPD
jgi:hypothetical protein